MECSLKDIFNEAVIESKRARGDNTLWKEFAKYYNKNNYIYDKKTFIKDFSNVFKQITGKELIKDKLYYVKNLDIGHGLSSGEIYTNYWIDTVMPYISKKLK